MPVEFLLDCLYFKWYGREAAGATKNNILTSNIGLLIFAHTHTLQSDYNVYNSFGLLSDRYSMQLYSTHQREQQLPNREVLKRHIRVGDTASRAMYKFTFEAVYQPRGDTNITTD